MSDYEVDLEDSGGAATPSATTPEVHPPEQLVRAPVRTADDAREAVAQLPARKTGRRSKEKVARGDGRCTAYAPKGTKCKLCGKVHPL